MQQEKGGPIFLLLVHWLAWPQSQRRRPRSRLASERVTLWWGGPSFTFTTRSTSHSSSDDARAPRGGHKFPLPRRCTPSLVLETQRQVKTGSVSQDRCPPYTYVYSRRGIAVASRARPKLIKRALLMLDHRALTGSAVAAGESARSLGRCLVVCALVLHLRWGLTSCACELEARPEPRARTERAPFEAASWSAGPSRGHVGGQRDTCLLAGPSGPSCLAVGKLRPTMGHPRRPLPLPCLERRRGAGEQGREGERVRGSYSRTVRGYVIEKKKPLHRLRKRC
ncbi:hypothetical protein BC826DRAFT_361195 [Russula brevipes]|nr:hypothetical protein BC826DRAFT_361195 [Russula brevipes]